NRIYICPVGLLGFVPQPNLRLPTVKLVGLRVIPFKYLTIRDNWRAPTGIASQPHLYISRWFVGFRASTQPTITHGKTSRFTGNSL
ncbi:hypothetical protein, partial [Cylindrospermopsis raciborskii]